jgi:hypothetical protein
MVLPCWLQRRAIALVVALLIAPVALFWHAFFPPSQTPEEGVSAPPPDPQVVRQFAALREEHERAMRQFHQELAAGPHVGPECIAEKHPGKKYFQRFVALAEQHPEHPMCPHIVGYALHCAGPNMAHEDHLRIIFILEHHHRLAKPGVRP